MHNTIIVRYAEIALKGKNRADFEKRLVENIRTTLKNCDVAFEKILRKPGRILILTESKAYQLKHVFGIASFSYASTADPNIEDIKKTVDVILKGRDFKTFRVTGNRIDKRNDLTSKELQIMIGDYVRKRYKKTVMLKGYDIDVNIEILDAMAFIFAEKKQGPGGLPIGSTGKVLVLSDTDVGNNSVKEAALLMMKRGCRVSFAAKAGIMGIKDLQKYNNYEDFNIEDYVDIEEVPGIVVNSKAQAIVVPYGSKDIQKILELKKSFDEYLILAPLMGLNDDINR